jgi:hypothetical protein
MEGTARIWFTPRQRAELWERWKNGQCVADIARALERRNKSGIYRILALNGGIAPEPRWSDQPDRSTTSRIVTLLTTPQATGACACQLFRPKCLILLVGAQGLEPWTR